MPCERNLGSFAIQVLENAGVVSIPVKVTTSRGRLIAAAFPQLSPETNLFSISSISPDVSVPHHVPPGVAGTAAH
jgi:hypothetical protein